MSRPSANGNPCCLHEPHSGSIGVSVCHIEQSERVAENSIIKTLTLHPDRSRVDNDRIAGRVVPRPEPRRMTPVRSITLIASSGRRATTWSSIPSSASNAAAAAPPAPRMATLAPAGRPASVPGPADAHDICVVTENRLSFCDRVLTAPALLASDEGKSHDPNANALCGIVTFAPSSLPVRMSSIAAANPAGSTSRAT